MSCRSRTGAIPLLLVAVALAAVAQTDVPRFRYERPVRPGGKGGNRLAVDLALLTGAAPVVYAYSTGAEGVQRMLPIAGLEDLRLYDAQGEEAPYRLVWTPRDDSAVRVPIAFEPMPKGTGESHFRLPLSGQGIPVTSIVVGVRGATGDRSAQVLERRVAGDTETLVLLGSAIVGSATEEGGNRIGISRPQTSELELAIADVKPSVLNIDSISAELAPLPWIYFDSASGDELTARFGARHVGPPRYEVEIPRGGVLAEAAWGERREIDAPVPGIVVGTRPASRRQPGEAGRARAVAIAAVALIVLLLAAAWLRRTRRRNQQGHSAS